MVGEALVELVFELVRWLIASAIRATRGRMVVTLGPVTAGKPIEGNVTVIARRGLGPGRVRVLLRAIETGTISDGNGQPKIRRTMPRSLEKATTRPNRQRWTLTVTYGLRRPWFRTERKLPLQSPRGTGGTPVDALAQSLASAQV